MDVKKELISFKKIIDAQLRQFLDAEIALVKKEDKTVADALGYTRAILLKGGKRIRGAMMYYGYLSAGGTSNADVIRACMSIELIHLYLLIHDDVMDRDSIRHGELTLHARYRSVMSNVSNDKDAEHFGNAIAISIGDMIASLGAKCLFSSSFPPDRIVSALNRLQGVIASTVVGQVKDMYMGWDSEIADEEEVLLMYRLKTARYTFEGPLGLGAVLAGGSSELLESFTPYAIAIGMAYQIQDDILGVYGTVESTGKSVGTDIEEKKMTLLVASAYSRGNRKQRRELKELLGKSISPNRLIRARSLFEETGALEFVRKKNEKLLDEAREAVRNIPSKNSEAKEFLSSLVLFLSKRNV